MNTPKLADLDLFSNTAWMFATANYTIAFLVEPEEDNPADYFEFPDDIAFANSGDLAHWFFAMVNVYDNRTGEIIGTDSLSGCSYNSISEFISLHRTSEPAHRNTLANRAKNIAAGSYFPDMVRAAIASARKNLPPTTNPKDEDMRNEDEDEKLDAYGHLNWTVGNEDWMACFDAIRKGDKIAYHVVVNCESGGFIDTVENGDVPATKEGIAKLCNLPSQYVDMCVDMYFNDPAANEYGEIEWEQCDREWREHLNHLLTLTPKEEDEEEDFSEEQSLDYFNRYIAGDR